MFLDAVAHHCHRGNDDRPLAVVLSATSSTSGSRRVGSTTNVSTLTLAPLWAPAAAVRGPSEGVQGVGGRRQATTLCEIGNAVFGTSPFRLGKYRFCLDRWNPSHQMAHIGFSTSQHLPTVRIEPRAEFFHAIGPEWRSDSREMDARRAPEIEKPPWASGVSIKSSLTTHRRSLELGARFL
jgi:hypothetical protein